MKKVISFLFVALILMVFLAGCGGVKNEDVIQAFKDNRLEAENTKTMTEEDYGATPMLAEEGIRFFIPSLGEGSSGRVLRFDNKEDLETTKKYYESLGKVNTSTKLKIPSLFSWVFVNDNILVQINGELPEEKAKKYEEALNDL